MPSANLADELAAALWPDPAPRESHTRAPVESVDGSTVTVLLRGSSEPTPCAKLSHVTAKAGDVALVLMLPSGGIVIGTIG